MKRTKKEQKARGRKYAAKLQQQHTLHKSDLASMAGCLLSKYNDKFDK